jgi:hypothetical protein
MAVAVGEIQLNITKRVPIGGGLAQYFGIATGGTEYPTGGATIGEDPLSRFPVPAHFEALAISAIGLVSRYVPGTGKLVLQAEATVATSTETGLAEYKSKASMAVAVAGVPFSAIGPQ